MRTQEIGEACDAVLKKWHNFLLLSDRKPKPQENAASSYGRIRAVIKYLMMGWEDTRGEEPLTPRTWKFLDQPGLLHRLEKVLTEAGKALPTRIKFYTDIIKFLKYFNSDRPEGSRLKGNIISMLISRLEAQLKGMGKEMAVHQMEVKAKKQRNLIPQRVLAACRRKSKERLPKVLAELEAAPPPLSNRQAPFFTLAHKFYGYLGCYIFCLYGKRPSALSKLTIQEVEQAEGNDAKGYLINVKEGKTSYVHAYDQLYLYADEYSWFTRFLKARKRLLVQSVPQRFLVTTGHSEVRVVRDVRKAWTEMGFQGSPDIMAIRTAVCTYNMEGTPPEVQKQVADFMCHSRLSHERFYAMYASLDRAQEIRKVFTHISAMDFVPRPLLSTPLEERGYYGPVTPPRSQPSAPSRTTPGPRKSTDPRPCSVNLVRLDSEALGSLLPPSE